MLFDSQLRTNQQWRHSKSLTHTTLCLCALELLVRSKANLDQANAKGETALYLSAHFGKTRCLRRLLEAKANPDLADRGRETPLLKVRMLAMVSCDRSRSAV